MNKNERLICYYDLSISARSKSIKAARKISVRKALKLISLVPSDKRNIELFEGKKIIYVPDLECDDDFVSILINKSDKEISDPVFTTPENNKRRTAKKEENEGQDFSVHMVIKLPNEDIDTALVLIEYCQGLTISMIKEVLKKILSDAKEISPEYFKRKRRFFPPRQATPLTLKA